MINLLTQTFVLQIISKEYISFYTNKICISILDNLHMRWFRFIFNSIFVAYINQADSYALCNT